MPKYYHIIYALLFILTGTTVSAQYEAKLAAINRSVARIDSAGPYIAKKLNDSCFAAKGRARADTMQELIGYYKKKQLAEMVHICRFSNGLITENMYFEAGQLIFIRVRTDVYPTRKNGQTAIAYTSKVIHKASYFFDDGELLELHNFGKGPMDKLSRSDKRDQLLSNTKDYKSWLSE